MSLSMTDFERIFNKADRFSWRFSLKLKHFASTIALYFKIQNKLIMEKQNTPKKAKPQAKTTAPKTTARQDNDQQKSPAREVPIAPKTTAQQDNDQPDNDQQKSPAQEVPIAPQQLTEASPEEKLEQLQKELDFANKKAEENWDKALRATAELENTKRRAEKSVSSAHKFALEKFAKELLPIIDSLEKSLEVTAGNDTGVLIKDGIELTLKMFLDTVKKFGVESIDPIDEPFDPHLHEAMTMVPSPEAESQTVIDVLQRGYMLNGRVIRAARVVVAQ